jgi:hypothetical protein
MFCKTTGLRMLLSVDSAMTSTNEKRRKMERGWERRANNIYILHQACSNRAIKPVTVLKMFC